MTTTPLIGLHLPGTYWDVPGDPYVEKRLKEWGRAELIEGLLDRNLPVFISRGQEAFDHEHGVVHGMEVQDTRREKDGTISLQVESKRTSIKSLAVIRNITGVVGHGVPELNDPAVRAITRDKLKTNDLLATIGLAKLYAGWTPGESIDEALDRFRGDEVVIKPTHGKQSIGVELGTKADIAAYARKLSGSNIHFVIEERVHTTPLEGIKGRDKQQQAIIDLVRREGTASELRAFTFGPNQTDFVLRVSESGGKTLADCLRVYIDPSSVPDEILMATELVEGAMRKEAGIKETHLGIDWVQLDSGAYVPMEINGGEPQLVYESDDKLTAERHVELVCQQLRRAALNGIVEDTHE